MFIVSPEPTQYRMDLTQPKAMHASIADVQQFCQHCDIILFSTHAVQVLMNIPLSVAEK